MEEGFCIAFWMRGRTQERGGWGWVCGGRWLTVVCMHEPNLPPSAVRVEDVRATEAPGPPSFSPSHSLFPPLFTGNVMLSAHICLSAEEGGWGYRRVGWRGHRHTGSLRCFPVAVDTCLPACAWLMLFLLTPPAPPVLPSLCATVHG